METKERYFVQESGGVDTFADERAILSLLEGKAISADIHDEKNRTVKSLSTETPSLDTVKEILSLCDKAKGWAEVRAMDPASGKTITYSIENVKNI